MGEDDERPNGQASRSVEPEVDPEDVAIELWRAVNCLHPSLRCPFNSLAVLPVQQMPCTLPKHAHACYC